MNKINAEKNLSVGKYILLEDEGMYCIASPHKDSNGNYRKSGWWSFLKEAEENIGNCYSVPHLNKWIEQENYKASIYTPKYEDFKVGDRVMIGKKVGIITKVFADTCAIDDNNIVQKKEIAYIKEPTETITIGGIKYSKDEVEKALQGIKEIK